MSGPDAGTLAMGDAAQVVADVHARWTAAFHANDWPAMQSLYTPDAQLFGGKQPLYTGQAGVFQYFDTIAQPERLRATYAPAHVIRPTPDTIVAAGYVAFGRDDGSPMRTYRMTQMLVRRDGQWLICSHHASPKDVFTPVP